MQTLLRIDFRNVQGIDRHDRISYRRGIASCVLLSLKGGEANEIDARKERSRASRSGPCPGHRVFRFARGG